MSGREASELAGVGVIGVELLKKDGEKGQAREEDEEMSDLFYRGNGDVR